MYIIINCYTQFVHDIQDIHTPVIRTIMVLLDDNGLQTLNLVLADYYHRVVNGLLTRTHNHRQSRVGEDGPHYLKAYIFVCRIQ